MFQVLTPIIRSWFICNYSCTSSWWWVSTAETCRADYRNVINWIQSLIVGQLFNLHSMTFYIHESVYLESNLLTAQQDTTVFSLLHFCRQLYMFRLLTPIIRCWYNCNYSFWHCSAGATTIRSRCWAAAAAAGGGGGGRRSRRRRRRNSTTRADGSRPGWPVPEAVITAVPAPDDGCQHPKHVEL